MICEGVFREDCLSLCVLQASPAAATQIMSDEGTHSVSELGAYFFGYFPLLVHWIPAKNMPE